jgi:Trk K+ transport system NAD-binding subunit
MTWLESGPGAELPPPASAPAPGRWVVCGYGRFGRHFTADLRAEQLEVTALDLRPGDRDDDGPTIVGDATDPAVMSRADLASAVGFVAGTDNDTTNMSLVAEARGTNPGLFVAARQNQPASAPLFAAMEVDALLVPTDVVAHDAYAQLSTPLLWRFLRELPGQGDAWAAGVVDRLAGACGTRLEELWKIRLNAAEAPAVLSWLSRGDLTLGDLVRSPVDREQRLRTVALMVLRGDESLMGPADDLVLQPDDQLLLAGRPAVRRQLETTLVVDAVPEYLVSGRRVPSSWIWRKLSRATPRRA